MHICIFKLLKIKSKIKYSNKNTSDEIVTEEMPFDYTYAFLK